MQNIIQKSKEKEGTQHKIPPFQKNETISQLKVRTDIHSGECKWVCILGQCYYWC
jgi:hypothetical protein